MGFRKLLFLFLIGFLLSFTAAFGQGYSAMADSIDTKFDQINKTSRNYQDSKIVKRYKLADLRTQSLRYINELAVRMDTLEKENAAQREAIADFKTQLEKKTTALLKTRKIRDQLSFLGMGVPKNIYQLIVIAVIVVLILLLLFYIYNFKKNRGDRLRAENNLADKEREFDEFRQSARAKHQKLARQLIDERKKNEENESDD